MLAHSTELPDKPITGVSSSRSESAFFEMVVVTTPSYARVLQCFILIGFTPVSSYLVCGLLKLIT